RLLRYGSCVGQRPVGRHQGEAGHVVGLWEQLVRQVVLRGESGDLTGESGRVRGGVKAGDAPDAVLAGAGGRPIVVQTEPVGGRHANTGDYHRGGHAAPLSGLVSTMALWNPPNPLPTVSTVPVCCSRAV